MTSAIFALSRSRFRGRTRLALGEVGKFCRFQFQAEGIQPGFLFVKLWSQGAVQPRLLRPIGRLA